MLQVGVLTCIAASLLRCWSHEASSIAAGISMAADVVWNFLSTPARPEAYKYPDNKISLYVVGQGRTGTTSLAAALRMLGYKVLHDDTAFDVVDLYGEHCRGEISADRLHERISRERGYNCSFFRDGYRWAAAREDVQVILTTRNPEHWVDSWLVVAPLIDFLYQRPFKWYRPLQDVLPHLEERTRNIPTGGHPEGYLDRETLLRGYQTHIQNVRRAIPEERLLEYSVREGWEPLCRFLNVSRIPDVPFPHVNERLRLRATLWTFHFISWTWPVLVALPVVALGWIVRKCARIYYCTARSRLRNNPSTE